MNRKNISIVVIIIVVLVAGWFVLFGRGGQKTPTATPVAAKATVQMTSQGFVPANLTINQGTTVEWVNQDAAPHQVVADPYPSGDSLPGLFAKQATASGDAYSYTFSKNGSYTYHDQLNPQISGTIVVQ